MLFVGLFVDVWFGYLNIIYFPASSILFGWNQSKINIQITRNYNYQLARKQPIPSIGVLKKMAVWGREPKREKQTTE